MGNKVKFNICNVHYALINVAENGEITYEKPKAIPGAVSISLDLNGEPESFYADGVEYYVINNNMGYDGDLEIALIPEHFLTDVLGRYQIQIRCLLKVPMQRERTLHCFLSLMVTFTR